MPSGGMSSHAEIWDDSALVDSWNDALEEYKKYHSIQARGENVKEVLAAYESKEATEGGMDYEVDRIDVLNAHHDAKAKSSEKTADHDTNAQGSGSKVQQVEDKHFVPGEESDQAFDSGSRKGPPALPQQLVGLQVHDEALKNLMISWYYAGYYTGLYEGQQQGSQDSRAKHQN